MEDKVLILTSRLTDDEDWDRFSKIGNFQSSSKINGQDLPYLQYSDNKVHFIVLKGTALNVTCYLGAEDKKLDKFKGIVESLIESIGKNLMKNKENYVLAIHWGRELEETAKEKTESLVKALQKEKIELSCLITYWSTSIDGEKDKYYFDRLTEENNFEILPKFQQLLHSRAKGEEKPSKGKLFALLEHRIAHLFLPLDIDLQGIEEVKSQEEGHQEKDGTSIKYLTEVLEEKKGKDKVNGSPCHYRRKLADLWWMVGRFKVQDSDFRNENPCIKERQYPVPPSPELETHVTESIFELVDKDADKMVPGQRDEIEKLNALLFELPGLEPNTSSLLKRKLSSPIFQFMCLLDCGIKEQKYDNVEQILTYFSKGWDIPGANPNPLNSFHDWFCALNECLDRLREKSFNSNE